MKISWRYIFIFLTLIVLCGLALLNQSLFKVFLIEPITRIAWLSIKTFLIIDQQLYWLLLIVAGIILFLRMIPDRSEPPVRKPYLNPQWSENRVAHWDALLQSAKDNPNARQALQQELESLSRTVQGLVEGKGETEISLPQVKKRFQWPGRGLEKAISVLRLRPLRAKDQALENKLDLILNSMEHKLEINNDSTTSYSNDD